MMGREVVSEVSSGVIVSAGDESEVVRALVDSLAELRVVVVKLMSDGVEVGFCDSVDALTTVEIVDAERLVDEPKDVLNVSFGITDV